MTSGTTTFNNQRVAKVYIVAPNGTSTNNGRVGSNRTKTWSGTNTSTPTRQEMGKRFTYTTVTKSGKVVTKHFKYRPLKRAKNRAPQAYTMSSSYLEAPPCGEIVFTATNGQQTRYYGPGLALSYIVGEGVGNKTPAPPSWTANDEIALIERLAEATKGSDFNMGVFLGESHQTLSMIADSATRLAKAYTQTRKGDVVSAFKTLYNPATMGRRRPRTNREYATQGVAQNWLELQYGWMPLLQDMKSGAELLSHQLHVPFRERQSVRITRRIPQSVLDSFNAAYTLPAAEVFTSKNLVAYYSEPLSIPVLSGLADPELIAWELVPFSFVADWVAPIGDYLSARAFASHISGTFVSTLMTKRVVNGIAFKQTAQGIYSGNGVYRVGSCTVQRTVSTSLRVPLPEVKPLDKVASWKHCVNALALVTQAFRA